MAIWLANTNNLRSQDNTVRTGALNGVNEKGRRCWSPSAREGFVGLQALDGIKLRSR